MGLMEYIARQIFRGLIGLSIDLMKDVSGQGNNEKGKQAEFPAVNNNCVIDDCNAMTYQESEYCLRHEAFPPKESKEETQQEENWWGDEKA